MFGVLSRLICGSNIAVVSVSIPVVIFYFNCVDDQIQYIQGDE